MNAIVEFKKDLGRLVDSRELALPSNVSIEAFKNAAIVAAQDNPKILQCDTPSVMKSLRTLAAAGLVPDGREAALVPFKTKDGNSWVDKCQAMPMVFGLIKMVRRSGEVKDIRAHIVYQKEVDTGAFEYVMGDEEILTHRPILFGERGDPVAAYAVARLKDGGLVREFMSAKEIDTVRRSSSAQKIYKKGEKPTTSDEPIGIWLDWWGEMWKKTVIRRLCKRLDMSSEDMRRVMVEEHPEETMRDVTPDMTPLQKKVAAAKGDLPPEDPIKEPVETDDDMTIDGTAEDTTEEHWTVAQDTSDAFPGADSWTEGEKARTAGLKRTMCPEDEGSQEAQDWLGGWDAKDKGGDA